MKIKDEARALLATLHYPKIDHAVIASQLDRRDYVRLNEALEALGGKWSRKDKAHVFAGKDARAVVTAALTVGEVTTAKDLGFFPTPTPVVYQLIDLARVEPWHRVLEPSAGDGAIVCGLLAIPNTTIIAIELDRDRVAVLRRLYEAGNGSASRAGAHLTVVPGDFSTFTLNGEFGFDRVVMNPPFTKAGLELDHVRLAHSMMHTGGRLVSVLPSGVVSRGDKKRSAFRAWAEGHGGTFQDLPAASFRDSGTMVSTCVLVMGKLGQS